MDAKELLERYKNGERNFGRVVFHGAKKWEYADLRGLDLRHADFTGAGLEGADFSGANLRGVNFSNANLSGAWFAGADCEDMAALNAQANKTNFKGANLTDAWLNSADLEYADFTGANLKRVGLGAAVLHGVIGITRFDCIGLERRSIYSYKHEGFIRFQLGCFNGTYDETITAIKGKYDNIELRKYLASYLASIEALKLTLEAQYDE